MAGLMLPTHGSVVLDGRPLSSLSDSERARLRRSSIGLIFQKLNLLSHLTAEENVALAISNGAKKTTAASALARVGLGEMAGVRASLLSGGEQQRVAVARVLAQVPEIVLADEPTSSLDDENARFVIEALKSAAQGKTLLVVSHDDRLHREFADVLALEDL